MATLCMARSAQWTCVRLVMPAPMTPCRVLCLTYAVRHNTTASTATRTGSSVTTNTFGASQRTLTPTYSSWQTPSSAASTLGSWQTPSSPAPTL
eukprot:2525456-Alexandrium_andersonii.AAC.1